jgi:excisionase family DNA binding protein
MSCSSSLTKPNSGTNYTAVGASTSSLTNPLSSQNGEGCPLEPFMNPDPTRLKIGDTLVEVRMNLIVNNLPVDHENLLNTAQAAKFLHVSVESLRRLVRRKAISSVSVLPSEHRFRKKDLEEYVMSRWNRRKSALR